MPSGRLFPRTSNALRNESQHVFVSVLLCLLDVFTLAEHNAEKSNKLLAVGAFGSPACKSAAYSIHLFIIVRFIIVSESLNGPFINQMSQRRTVYAKQTLVGSHDVFYS